MSNCLYFDVDGRTFVIAITEELAEICLLGMNVRQLLAEIRLTMLTPGHIDCRDELAGHPDPMLLGKIDP